MNEHHPKECLDTDEFLKFRKEVLDELRAKNPTGELISTGDDEDMGAPPGDDDAPPGEEDDEATITVVSNSTRYIRTYVSQVSNFDT